MKSKIVDSVLQGCQPLTSSNIENWQGRDNRWCHNARNMTSFVQQNMQKRCCWNCNIFLYLIGLLPPPPITLLLKYYNGILCFLRKRSMIKVKIAQTMQNILNFIDRKSNLETGRNGSKSGVSRIIRESWLHWSYVDLRHTCNMNCTYKPGAFTS